MIFVFLLEGTQQRLCFQPAGPIAIPLELPWFRTARTPGFGDLLVSARIHASGMAWKIREGMEIADTQTRLGEVVLFVHAYLIEPLPRSSLLTSSQARHLIANGGVMSADLTDMGLRAASSYWRRRLAQQPSP